jgi:hypothetical protein
MFRTFAAGPFIGVLLMSMADGGTYEFALC